MKKILAAVILLTALKTGAQTVALEELRPLILIDTLFTYNESMIVHPSKFLSISTIDPENAMKIYGPAARFGIIKIQARPSVQLERLKAILDRYKIEEKYRTLKVCIDHSLIPEPDKLLADPSQVKGVEIISGVNASGIQSGKDEFYLNIITAAP